MINLLPSESTDFSIPPLVDLENILKLHHKLNTSIFNKTSTPSPTQKNWYHIYSIRPMADLEKNILNPSSAEATFVQLTRIQRFLETI